MKNNLEKIISNYLDFVMTPVRIDGSYKYFGNNSCSTDEYDFIIRLHTYESVIMVNEYFIDETILLFSVDRKDILTEIKKWVRKNVTPNIKCIY